MGRVGASCKLAGGESADSRAFTCRVLTLPGACPRGCRRAAVEGPLRWKMGQIVSIPVNSGSLLPFC